LGVDGKLAQRTRQEVSLLQVGLDQGVELFCVRGTGRSQRDPPPGPLFHSTAPTAPNAASRRSSASSTSLSVMTSGGNSRPMVSATSWLTSAAPIGTPLPSALPTATSCGCSPSALK